ncbi:MAG: PAS domain S-box protein [Candidatus Zixiibacteriota bacterium]|jgi:PAS domain S-box-containing protein
MSDGNKKKTGNRIKGSRPAEQQRRVSDTGTLLTRESEDNLCDAGKLFLQLANTVPAYLWIGDAEGNITFLNDVWYSNTGRTKEQSLGTAWAEVLHPDDVDRCLKRWQESLSEGKVYEVEVRYRMADGSYRWVLARAEPQLDASGKITNWFGTSIDIEEKKHAEAALKKAHGQLETRVNERTAELARALDRLEQSQEQFRLAVDHYPATFVIYDGDRRIQYINSYGAELIGVSPDSIVGRRDEEVQPPEVTDAFLPLLIKTVESRQPQSGECTIPLKSDSYTFIASYVPVLDDHGEIRQILGITHDVTERKRAEEQREILQKAVDTSNDGTTIVSADSSIIYTNPAFERMFGYEPGELIGKDVAILNAGPDAERTRSEIMIALAEHGAWHGEVRNITKDGTVFITEASTAAVTDADGRMICLISNQRDITERKISEQALKNSEAEFRTLAEVAPVGIYLTNEKGQCTYANQRWCAMAGMTVDEALGEGWAASLHPDDREEVFSAWNEMVASEGKWGKEYRFITPDGKVTWISGYATAVRDEAGKITGYIGANVDITERRQAEEEREQLLTQVVEERQAAAELADVIQRERDILNIIMENTRTQLAYLDRDFNFVGVNSAYVEGCGRPVEELVGRNHFELFPDPENEAIFTEVRDSGEPTEFHKKPFEYIDQPERGTTYWDWTLVPVKDSEGTVQGLVFSLLDVTEEVRADKILEEINAEVALERRRLEAVLNALPVGVLISDARGQLLQTNPAASAVWGGETPLVDSPDSYGTYRAFWPDTGRQLEAHEWGLARALTNGEKSEAEEVEIETFDGKRKTILNYALPIRDGDGKIVGGVAVNVDITERKKAQEAVRKGQERLKLAQKLANIGVWDWDIINDRLVWSEEVAPILGLPSQTRETVSQSFFDSVHPEDKPRITQAVEACLSEAHHYKEEHRVVWPDGTVRWVEEIGDVLRNRDGKAVRMVGMIYDVTDQRVAFESKARLAAIVESSSDAMITKAIDGTISTWNLGAERMYGYSAEEIIGQPITVLIPPDKEDEESKIVAKLERGERIEQFETIRVRKNGERILASLTISPIKDEQGRVVAAATTARDITAQKQAERALRESEERFRVAITNSKISVAMVDRDLRYTWVSNEPKEFPLGKLLGKRMEEVNPAEGALEWSEAKQRVLDTGAGVREEVPLRFADGMHYFDLTAEPLRDQDGEIIGVTSAAIDVTDRKHAEEDMKAMNEMLARHAARLAETNKELEAFSYSVSHDLRAPLRSINGFSLALLEDYGDRLDEDGRDYLNRVRSASEKMAQLIDDLLQLSRVSRAAINHEDLDLTAMAHEIAETVKDSEPERNVTFIIEDDMTAHGDRLLLNLVIENLFRNSWKFTSKHPTAKIEFGRTQVDGGMAFYVRDDGAGFDMKFSEKLFLPFQRLHSVTDFPGTGVGLPLVQRIIDRHGGRVWAEGEVEKGATFYFQL